MFNYFQAQLKQKHAELSRRIQEQQEDLRRISEQLVMSQFGLVPVHISTTAQRKDQGAIYFLRKK